MKYEDDEVEAEVETETEAEAGDGAGAGVYLGEYLRSCVSCVGNLTYFCCRLWHAAHMQQS